MKGDYQMMKFIALGVFKGISAGALGVCATVLILELAVGCGQVTYFPNRTWVTNECLFIPAEINYGRW